MRKLFLLCAVMFCVCAANAQAEYPDVPLDDPAYAEINLLSEQGIIECSTPGRRAVTRYEFAVAIATVVQSIMQEKENSKQTKSFLLTKFRKNQPVSFAALHRLIDQFSPELPALGLNKTEIANFQQYLNTEYSRIANIKQTPFKDVLQNHWAFPAIEKLRQSGVLIGHPEGSFLNRSTLH